MGVVRVEGEGKRGPGSNGKRYDGKGEEGGTYQGSTGGGVSSVRVVVAHCFAGLLPRDVDLPASIRGLRVVRRNVGRTAAKIGEIDIVLHNTKAISTT